MRDWAMLDLAEVKRLLSDDAVSDEEAVRIRNACYELASIIVDYWKWKQRANVGSDESAFRRDNEEEMGNVKSP